LDMWNTFSVFFLSVNFFLIHWMPIGSMNYMEGHSPFPSLKLSTLVSAVLPVEPTHMFDI